MRWDLCLAARASRPMYCHLEHLTQLHRLDSTSAQVLGEKLQKRENTVRLSP